MTVTKLPGAIQLKQRDRVVKDWKRSHRIRVPEADTGTGTQPDTDARVAADIVMALYATAKVSGDNTVLEQATGEAVDQWGEREGVDKRREAVGASGAVIYAGSTGGSTILENDEIKNETTGLRYRVIRTDHYVPGDLIDIVGKDTGPETNVEAGTQLKWTSPRPGCSDFALVAETSTGSGLTGGADRENDDDCKARIGEEKKNRAASGNDAEYQLEAEKTPNVSVLKAFSHPGIRGPGTTCVVILVAPARPGGSRAPSSTQVGLVETHITSEFPADDGLFMGLVADEPADVSYSFVWSETAASWADVVPWPPFYASPPVSGPGGIQVSAATSATVFTLATSNASYTGVRQPTIGQTIAFSDVDNSTYVRKRILSFTGTGPWVITCDTSNNASDTGYTPIVGQRACPWSDSLTSTLYTPPNEATEEPAKGVFAYFDGLGPGEQVESFYDDEGFRQRRMPRPPKSWPSELTTRGLIDAAKGGPEVADVDVLEGDGLAPSVGTAGVLSYILLPRFIAGFPEI